VRLLMHYKHYGPSVRLPMYHKHFVHFRLSYIISADIINSMKLKSTKIGLSSVAIGL
jgi:hypothetical protein